VRSQLRLNEAARSIELVEKQLELVSNVTSPYSGRILEVKRDRGDIVTAGTPVVNLQLSGDETQGLQAVIYVPPGTGKQVGRGMEAQISPTTAAREEFGFLLGKVTYVSEFPSTFDGMMRVLSNPALVNTLSAAGPPYAVYADLVQDRGTTSGFKWSSKKGDELKVAAGTICNVTLTVRERRPIEMVIPIIREYTGL
jgi:HlyD family secretion protein